MAWPDTEHTVLAELFRGGSWQASTVREGSLSLTHGATSGDTGDAAPAACRLVLDAKDGALAQLPRGTPIRVSVNGLQRFIGVVASRSLSWDGGSGTAWLAVVASSELARLRESGAPLRDAYHRWVLTTSPVAFWPLDDGPLATVGVPLVGSYPMVLAPRLATSSYWGQGDLGPILDRGVALHGGDKLAAAVNMVAAFSDRWAVDWVRASDHASDGTLEVFQQYFGSWRVTFQSNTDTVVTRPDGTTVGTGILPAEEYGSAVDSGPHHVRFACTQAGSDVAFTVAVDGVTVISDTYVAHTLQPVGLVELTDLTDHDQLHALGRVVIYTTAPAVATAAQAAFGWAAMPGLSLAAEAAGRRAERLCDEEDIAFVGVGDLDDTQEMGPQPAGLSLVEHLQQCADADAAMVYDGSGGVMFRGRADLQNQSVALALTYGTRGHVKPPLAPVEDDHVVNDVAVTRYLGPAVQVQRTTGPLAVSVVGSRSATPTVNVAVDDQARHLAGWLVHVGTAGEPRYELHLDLLALAGPAPALVTDALAVAIGDRLTVAGLPIWCYLPTADLMVTGTTESVPSAVGWDLTYACVPYTPYQVGELDTAWSDTDGTSLTADLTAGATSFIADIIGPLWTTNGADFPTTIRIDGEDMTLTGVSGGSSPQTFTVTRTAGVEHDAGVAVQLVHPLVLTP
jgi:hypothetical protein